MRETSKKLQDFLFLTSVGARSLDKSAGGFLGSRETAYPPGIDKIVAELERRFMSIMGIFEWIVCFNPDFLLETSVVCYFCSKVPRHNIWKYHR